MVGFHQNPNQSIIVTCPSLCENKNSLLNFAQFNTRYTCNHRLGILRLLESRQLDQSCPQLGQILYEYSYTSLDTFTFVPAISVRKKNKPKLFSKLQNFKTHNSINIISNYVLFNWSFTSLICIIQNQTCISLITEMKV